ncbi:hypothetical protein COU17_02745 [Candidatus Kaiserbacteria bacterium CG10_big_fil_rev_8_21_14_0_10_49_17]|uniref:BioF2-like acetyltransferase domain-containing protein n=1 Tax=Candidatus Kaiserbacteria bacterium CG10_big_fil_rev_8_21_14_0_10_49_17 TaxID=1974609 RepID=A0A2M6WDY0_9BACT|nr:MAG: hypothetical protein COU17_02745 [Candidatus Kaiserbacteria bacterium CG10_big_fil_rev_8_21_14_0_10_49_17]
MKNRVTHASLFGLPYSRFLTQDASLLPLDSLRKRNAYIHIYSYARAALPGFEETSQHIIIINLRHSLEDIFDAFKKNTRNEIRKTENIPELTFSIPDRKNRDSYRFYTAIKKRDGVTPDAYIEFRGCLFFNAYYKGKMIVSVSCYDTGEILRLKHIVSERKNPSFDATLIGYATRRVMWELCKYGKERGYSTIDLAGANVSEANKSGITAFKQSFGGELKEIWVYRSKTPAFRWAQKGAHMFGKNIH